ncbi:MAG: efflux RND transporter permease subunit, partial [Gemmatimonadota bacterium]
MLLVALGSGAGIWAAFHLPSAIYPQLDFQRVVIVAQGTALGAEQQVFSVTRPLEAAASVVPAVERVRSRTIRGATEISVSFSPGTDMVEALQLVRAQVNQIRSELPPELELEIQRMQPSLFPILTYSLVGGDPADLYDLARYEIKPVILRIPDVGRVDIQSGAVREMEVIADPSRLATVGLSYGDLAEAIRQAIGVDAVGRVNRDYEQYLVVTDQTARSAEDVGNVVVRGGLRVRDIARVELGTEDRVRLIVSGGQPASLINISLQRDGNTVAVADSVARTMNTVQASLPPGTRLDAVYDQASLVREAVSSVRDAMLVGALLVVIVLGLFLRESRITAIAAASIPLTMAITILGLRLLGQTFNLMSLGGMAIAIGLVIDDAVVVTENIARHLELGHTRRDAVRDAVAELLWPVTTSTLTTVVVFLPLGLLQGVVGQFFAALSIALASAVLVSLVLALTLVPLLCDRFLSGDNATPRVDHRWRQASAGIGRALERLSSSYERSLNAALRHPGRVGILALGLVAAGVLSAGFVGTGFLPIMDEEAFVLDYFTPGGTALEETDRELGIVEDILADVPEIIGDARRTGSEMGLFATGQNTGDFAVRLSPRRSRSRDVFAVIDEVRERIQTALPRMRVEFVQVLTDVINDLAGNPAPVEIKLFGDRLEGLETYARQLAPSLAVIDGL